MLDERSPFRVHFEIEKCLKAQFPTIPLLCLTTTLSDANTKKLISDFALPKVRII